MKIGVLMGGLSSEREVSLLSGNEIVNNLNKEKYEVFPIVINSIEEIIEKVKGMDFIFLALHGEFGEDGYVQGILESISMPYSGCNLLTSAICMNKKQAKRIMRAEGIAVADDFSLVRGQDIDVNEIDRIGYPMIVKPNNGGSSIGVAIAKNRYELNKAIGEAFKYNDEVLVEEFLEGSEYTVPVLNGVALPIISIIPKGDFFDYNSKYINVNNDDTVAKLFIDLQDEIKNISEKCWNIFDCKAYINVDIIVKKNKPYVLEINTLPGMTRNSLLPKSAKAANINYSELLDRIIQYSTNKN